MLCRNLAGLVKPLECMEDSQPGLPLLQSKPSYMKKDITGRASVGHQPCCILCVQGCYMKMGGGGKFPFGCHAKHMGPNVICACQQLLASDQAILSFALSLWDG